LFNKSDVVAFLGILYCMGSLSCDLLLISGLPANDSYFTHYYYNITIEFLFLVSYVTDLFHHPVFR